MCRSPPAQRLFQGWRSSSEEFCPPYANTLVPPLYISPTKIIPQFPQTNRKLYVKWGLLEFARVLFCAAKGN